jgi:chromate transporter
MRGVNAAVVGLLGAALYNPVWTTSVKVPADFATTNSGGARQAVSSTKPTSATVISALGGIAEGGLS